MVMAGAIARGQQWGRCFMVGASSHPISRASSTRDYTWSHISIEYQCILYHNLSLSPKRDVKVFLGLHGGYSNKYLYNRPLPHPLQTWEYLSSLLSSATPAAALHRTLWTPCPSLMKPSHLEQLDSPELTSLLVSEPLRVWGPYKHKSYTLNFLTERQSHGVPLALPLYRLRHRDALSGEQHGVVGPV